MLPTGHAAAGFLLADLVVHFSGCSISEQQTNILLLVGAFSGFAPDLDMFPAFLKAKSFSFSHGKVNHRDSILHTPLFWIALGTAIALTDRTQYGVLLALVTSMGGLSHLFFDSFKMGIRWFWPLDNTYRAFMFSGEDHHYHKPQKTFFGYWFTFLRSYATDKTFRPTFILETLLLISAVITLIARFI